MSASTQGSSPMQNQPSRYYAFDHVKTAMMIGVVIAHSALSYIVVVPGKVWPAKDPQTTSLGFDVLVSYLACITMPVFFAISGFLTVMLIDKQGIQAMIKNRLQRIVLPLLVSLFTLIPLTAAAFYYFEFMTTGAPSPFKAAFVKVYNDGFGLQNFKLMHLWFLYCLVLFCLIGGVVSTFVKSKMPAVANKTSRVFSVVYNTKAAPFLFAIPTFLLLSLRATTIIETPLTFITDPGILVSHAVFFVFGWLLYYQKDITRFKKGAVFFAITGLLFYVAKLALYASMGQAGTTSYVVAAVNAIFVWTLVFGHLGLFLKYFDNYSRVGRYLSDASYWIYLVHLPVVITLQALLTQYALSAGIKFLLVAALTFFMTIVSYNYLVRDTFIGAFINGRRYKRGLPK